MLIVGLTGGIGSGKSAACRYFSDLNVPVYDADVIAHKLVQADQPALHLIIDQFGPEYLTSEGSLNRAYLRKTVFENPKKRIQLENILHPLVRSQLLAYAKQAHFDYCIFSIPLLVESHQQDLVHRILVIDSPEELQISRGMKRDRQSRQEIEAILAVQLQRNVRLSYADDIIENDKGLAELKTKVEEKHQFYLSIAKNKKYS